MQRLHFGQLLLLASILVCGVRSITFTKWPDQVTWGQTYDLEWTVESSETAWYIWVAPSTTSTRQGITLYTLLENTPAYDGPNPVSAKWQVETGFNLPSYCLGYTTASDATFRCAVMIPVSNVQGAPSSASIVASSLVSGSSSPATSTSTSTSVSTTSNPSTTTSPPSTSLSSSSSSSSSATSSTGSAPTTFNGAASTSVSISGQSPSPNPTPPPPPPPSGLSGGAIAGIVVGVLAGVALVITAAVLLLRRRRKAKQQYDDKNMQSTASTAFTTPELPAGPFSNRHELRGSQQYMPTPTTPVLTSGVSELEGSPSLRPTQKPPSY